MADELLEQLLLPVLDLGFGGFHFLFQLNKVFVHIDWTTACISAWRGAWEGCFQLGRILPNKQPDTISSRHELISQTVYRKKV